MACPFFEPAAPLLSEPADRVPLGQSYSGTCSAGPIAADSDFRLCNCGYARGLCANFPDAAAVDAFRFARIGISDILWIEERDHAPVRFGVTIDGSVSRSLSMQYAVFVQSVRDGRIG